MGPLGILFYKKVTLNKEASFINRYMHLRRRSSNFRAHDNYTREHPRREAALTVRAPRHL